MFVDEERQTMDWRERIYGYTGVVGMIQAFAAGYFIWYEILFLFLLCSYISPFFSSQKKKER